MPGPISSSFSTVRDTSPDTVEFRQAEGIRKSSRVPNRSAQWPGSASTARSRGEHRTAVALIGVQRAGELAGDRALAGPAVDEHHVARVVVARRGGAARRRRSRGPGRWRPRSAAGPGRGRAAPSGASGCRPGCRRGPATPAPDARGGPPGPVSVTTPTAAAIRAAVSASAAWNSSLVRRVRAGTRPAATRRSARRPGSALRAPRRRARARGGEVGEQPGHLGRVVAAAQPRPVIRPRESRHRAGSSVGGTWTTWTERRALAASRRSRPSATCAADGRVGHEHDVVEAGRVAGVELRARSDVVRERRAAGVLRRGEAEDGAQGVPLGVDGGGRAARGGRGAHLPRPAPRPAAAGRT